MPLQAKALDNPSFEIRTTPSKGKGIFALKSFMPGDVIETAPILIIPQEQEKSLENTVLYNYTFAWGENGRHSAVVMGYGSFYNHSYNPNAYYRRDLEKECLEIIAYQPIKAGEEITFNYNGFPTSQDPLWFPVVEE